MASTSGNLNIIEDGNPSNVSGTTEKRVKEELVGDEARIALHFFEKELHELNDKACITREPDCAEPQRLIVDFDEKKAPSVRKLIDNLKTKVRELPSKSINVASAKLKDLDRKVDDSKDKKEVLILRCKETGDLKIVGRRQGEVDAAVHSLETKLDITAATGMRNTQGAANSENNWTYAQILTGGNRLNKTSGLYDSTPVTGASKPPGGSKSPVNCEVNKTVNFTKSVTTKRRSSSADGFDFKVCLNGGFVLKVYKASITRLKVDAIVNAANDVMMHGGGVARVISEAAGYDLDRESTDYVQKYGPVKVSENIVTSAGRLPYKGVIHAVGPMWHDYKYGEKAKCLKDLYSCVWNILKSCEQNRYRTVGMSAISAGIFAVPKSLCADMYVKAAVDYSAKFATGEYNDPNELHIIDVDTSILHLVQESVEKWQRDPSLIELEGTLKKYLKENPQAAGYSAYSTSNYSGNTHRGYRSKGHGRGQESYNQGSYNQGSFDKRLGNSDDNVKDHDLELDCKLQKKSDEKIYWGAAAKVYEFDDGQITVKIFLGQIDKSNKMDAVVSAVDKSLKAGGYLHDALKRAGGYTFEDNFKRMVDNNRHSVKPLDVFRCAGGKLGVSDVMYVVMGRVVDGNEIEMQTYKEAIKNILEKAREWDLKKLVIPMFGTGNIQTNSNKLRKCCIATLKGIDCFLNDRGNKSKVREIHLVNNSDSVTSLLQEVFDKAAKTGRKIAGSGNTKPDSSYGDATFGQVDGRGDYSYGSQGDGGKGNYSNRKQRDRGNGDHSNKHQKGGRGAESFGNHSDGRGNDWGSHTAGMGDDSEGTQPGWRSKERDATFGQVDGRGDYSYGSQGDGGKGNYSNRKQRDRGNGDHSNKHQKGGRGAESFGNHSDGRGNDWGSHTAGMGDDSEGTQPGWRSKERDATFGQKDGRRDYSYGSQGDGGKGNYSNRKQRDRGNGDHSNKHQKGGRGADSFGNHRGGRGNDWGSHTARMGDNSEGTQPGWRSKERGQNIAKKTFTADGLEQSSDSQTYGKHSSSESDEDFPESSRPGGVPREKGREDDAMIHDNSSDNDQAHDASEDETSRHAEQQAKPALGNLQIIES